ncbi:hypothetical protein ABKA04_004065 [Annulohypoxylon sp. FPYF3050]
MFTEAKPLQRDHHNTRALEETSQIFTETASLPQTYSSIDDQIPPSSPDDEQASLTHCSHSKPRPTSGVESLEISRSSVVFGDRRLPDGTDPSDSLPTSDAGIPFKGQHLNPVHTFIHHHDSDVDSHRVRPNELLLHIGGEEANTPVDHDLEIDCDSADAIPPQRHLYDRPPFNSAINQSNIAHLPGNSGPLAVWTDSIFTSQDAPHQLPNVGSAADQGEISVPLIPFSPNLSCHEGSDGHHISEAPQTIITCEPCSRAAESKGQLLACHFYKFDPKRYFECNPLKTSTIGHLMQHLKHKHMLAKHDCKRCWSPFKDKASLREHTDCQPMGGKPVNDLAPVSRARDVEANIKWIWVWRELFGPGTPEPQCPYWHPVPDLCGDMVRNLCKSLEKKGNTFTLDEVKEAASDMMRQVVAPSQSAIDRKTT